MTTFVPSKDEIIARRIRLGMIVPPKPVVIPKRVEPDPVVASPPVHGREVVEPVSRVSRESVRKAIMTLVEVEEEPPTARVLLSRIATATKIDIREITGECRRAEVVLARHYAMWFLVRKRKLSATQVGRLVGGRDHTTVLHALRKIDAMFAERGGV
jgi:hypothetical protein